MNLNANPRFEQFDVSDDPAIYATVDDVMREIWQRSPALAAVELRHHDAVQGLAAGGEVAEMPLARQDYIPAGNDTTLQDVPRVR